MSQQQLSFIHRFEPGGADEMPPLLLLHGTGGNEADLLSLGKAVAPGSALLSPRGKVLEHGLPRFFRRFAEGVFDEDDVRRRADELADFVGEAREAYGLAAPIVVGLSNGGNIAAALLLLRPDVLAAAVLLRAMMPFADPPMMDLTDKPILLISGDTDVLIPIDNAERLAEELSRNGAVLRHEILHTGHRLTEADIALIRAWIEEHAGTSP